MFFLKHTYYESWALSILFNIELFSIFDFTISSPSLTFWTVRFYYSFDVTDLREGQHEEGPPSAGFDDDRQELWVDGTEWAVPCHLGDPDVIVRLLSLDGLAEDVAKLALPHDAATHGWGEARRGGLEAKKNEDTIILKIVPGKKKSFSRYFNKEEKQTNSVSDHKPSTIPPKSLLLLYVICHLFKKVPNM